MDVSYASDLNIQCFKSDQPALSSLNINTSNSTTILWNKFQMFLYESLLFESCSKNIIPEFQIWDLMTSNNYIVCLDYSGNIHLTSSKFKNAAQSKLKLKFQPREHNILACTLCNENQTVSLKLESNTYILNVHRINTDFTIDKKILLLHDTVLPPLAKKEKCILKCHTLTEQQFEIHNRVFKTPNIHSRTENKILILTIDKMNVFSCIFNPKMAEDQTTLIKLYSCPSEISSIEIEDLENLNVLIGLNIGTVIRICLKDISNPEIIHLNTAIHKLSIFNNTLLYSDGMSLWKAEYVSNELKFSQFFIKHVKDFIKIGDQIVCTTFMNLIYTFYVDDDKSYLKPETDSEYCSADKLFSNYDYLNKILETVKANDSLAKTLNQEKNYITALSLSNRQDIMDKVIDHKIKVYETYEDCISEESDIQLTNHYAEYFDTKSLYFLIKMSTVPNNKLTAILSSSLGDIKLHIALKTKDRLLKTTSLTVVDQLKKINLLVPLEFDKLDITEVTVNIKILCNIPGAFDFKKKIWTVLYRKSTILQSEHFIQFNTNINRNICLKVPQIALAEQIMQASKIHHGNLFEFTDMLKNKPLLREWDLFVRLPTNYKDIFKNEEYCQHQLNVKKSQYLIKQLTTENFLKSNSNVALTLGNEKVNIEIVNDGFSEPLLKITSDNLKIALHIRNFLSDIVYNHKNSLQSGKEFVSHSFYITVENLQRAIRSCITGSSQEEILTLIEQFEKNVIGLLPV